MFARKALYASLWIAVSTAFPALAIVDPVVDAVIDRVPDKAPVYVTPNTPPPNVPSPIKADPKNASRYDDGKVYRGAVVAGRCPCGCERQGCHCGGYCGTGGSGHAARDNVGWWQRGPGRRAIAGSGRWLGRVFRWRRR